METDTFRGATEASITNEAHRSVCAQLFSLLYMGSFKRATQLDETKSTTLPSTLMNEHKRRKVKQLAHSHMARDSCSSSFALLWQKTRQKQHQAGRADSGSQAEDVAHHGGEGPETAGHISLQSGSRK